MDTIKEALTFDDVTLAPKYSEILPSEVNTETKLSKNLSLKIPLLSSAMDTVTEAKMAIAMARAGGIGVIHRNLDVKKQIVEIKKVKKKKILVGAVCVYHNLVSHAKKQLYGKLPVAAVSTGFPAGLSSFETRKKEITNSIKAGANEIDIVINRAYVLQNDWQKLYDEVRTFKEIAREKKIKVIFIE